MGWLMARLYDRVMARTESAGLVRWREQLLGDASGWVLEIGAGTGANLEHYGGGVTRLVLSEPESAMRARLQRRLRDARPGLTVAIEGAGADSLPFSQGTFDAVVSTLVLCSVPDVARALAEARRVLKPGGRLFFLEHVAAEEGSSRLRWQRGLEPLWKRIAGNCHLTRRTAEEIERAGFAIENMRRRSLRKALPFVRPTITGVARR